MNNTKSDFDAEQTETFLPYFSDAWLRKRSEKETARMVMKGGKGEGLNHPSPKNKLRFRRGDSTSRSFR